MFRARNEWPRTDGSSGFTLAEMLVATTLLAIVMTAVYTALSGAIRGWRMAETNVQTYEDARLALGLMSRELQAVQADTAHLFIGDADELEFFAVTPPMHPDIAPGAQVLKITYRLAGGDVPGGRTLVREEALVESALPAWNPDPNRINAGRIRLGRTRRIEMASRVRDFKIRYHWAPLLYQLKLPPGVPPPQNVKILVKDENRKGWGLPDAVELVLTLEEETPSSSTGRQSFSTMTVFRRQPRPMPKELIDEWEGLR